MIRFVVMGVVAAATAFCAYFYFHPHHLPHQFGAIHEQDGG